MKVQQNKFKLITTLLISMILLSSCSDEIFGVKKSTSSTSVAAKNTYTSQQICSDHSVIRPKVDFLFLWDNSSSQTYVSSALKSGFNNLVYRISSDFDYHILMAPLIRSSSSAINVNASLVSYDNEDLTSSALNMQVNYDVAATKLDQIVSTYSGTNLENGFYRAYELISNNRSNGVFRSGSYLIVVVMSNGDVRKYENGYWTLPYDLSADKARLLNLRTALGSEQLRFMSLVSHGDDGVPIGHKKGYAYINMSAQIYSDGGHKTTPTDQSGNATPDSYNIVGADYNYIFEGINSSISMVTVVHKYDYWPVTLSGNFDPQTIKVTKYTSNGNYDLTPNDTENGFVYVGYRTNQNTRYEPTAGEPYTGNMVRLYGDGRISYPDCAVITADEVTQYQGYAVLSGKPNVSTISCTKNGSSISQSTTNGWEYIGYKTNQNIMIESLTNPDNPGYPASYQTGYMLKLHGDAILSNQDSVSCTFDPSS